MSDASPPPWLVNMQRCVGTSMLSCVVVSMFPCLPVLRRQHASCEPRWLRNRYVTQGLDGCCVAGWLVDMPAVHWLHAKLPCSLHHIPAQRRAAQRPLALLAQQGWPPEPGAATCKLSPEPARNPLCSATLCVHNSLCAGTARPPATPA